ncbi:TPA: nucleoside-specific channel-forming protein Tsx, partial [Salmonella enterica]|nr:nucleoside-specific channel-forming protein Tsx [Salmonella enterica subsp. enterica serovar Abony]EBY3659458.1 nucleoside-specific channel-forming protein Tsx [Salmonella enterica subsp. enterica serovar Abony]EDD6700913.1 nucleoside-specific channel-forming protein Tsx [Salmonella enterica subsp. enterica serovar Abony]EDW6541689.1 nucleoside-specific channel-forming protein Tsx [Salmonella enterica subsp. enterica serovar Abony]HAF4428208.1 nucleoside-specific channel-forming protein Tsx 
PEVALWPVSGACCHPASSRAHFTLLPAMPPA